jgi:hypothetical protein
MADSTLPYFFPEAMLPASRRQPSEWVDPGTIADTEHIEDHILNLTGGVDLADARRIFYADPLKRIDTLLGNADSVACLITQLGRQLDPIPSSRPVSPVP